MTDRRGVGGPVAIWLERSALGVLLGLAVLGIGERGSTNARLDVVIERQTQAASIQASRSTHEARLAMIEATRFTHDDGRAIREKFDGELLSVWRELHAIKESMPIIHDGIRQRLEDLMCKLEERIRAVENRK